MRIASTVQNNIWWNYVDQEEYFEMAEGDGRRYLPDVPRPHSYEMKEFDYHVSEICDFLQTFTVLIVSVAGSIIAVFLFYKHKLKCPIEELELASRQVGRNNLDFHITYENEDEMGGLCKEFERMRGQLAENNQQLWKMLEEEKALRAAIAHDIRSPLSVLEGYQEMLSEYLPKKEINMEQALEMVNESKKQIERMDRTIHRAAFCDIDCCFLCRYLCAGNYKQPFRSSETVSDKKENLFYYTETDDTGNFFAAARCSWIWIVFCVSETNYTSSNRK